MTGGGRKEAYAVLHRATFGIGGAIVESPDARKRDCRSAHGAGFERDIEVTFGQPLGPQLCGRGADRRTDDRSGAVRGDPGQERHRRTEPARGDGRVHRCHVAARLLTRSDELEALAAGVRNLPVLEGWRYEVFGRDALELVEGRLAFGVVKGRLSMTRVENAAQEAAGE